MIAETVCSAVSAAGLGIAVVTAYRKRFLAAARIAAYALVPVGLVMTGVVGWLSGTAFSPVAWAGFGVLGAAWLLFATTRAVERRRAGRTAAAAGQAPAVAPPPPPPPLALGRRDRSATAPRTSGAAGGPAAAQSSGASGTSASGGSGDDFRDIEAILKKHGI
ncbi:hypothetical protein ACIPRD_25035 [Streptomyces sp. NPDC090108]|uniref:hypothetical protein n=1 Tax=Streptomyces sp. NPDC090108 TaxID=3365947 RepID=UPI003812355D